MYDPKIARFLQEDTYLGDRNDPLSLNLYTYCYNNPIIYFDPTGHVVTKWDESHLSNDEKTIKIGDEWKTELEALEYYGQQYNISSKANNKSSTNGTVYWHDQAERLRNKYRESGERGDGTGYTLKDVYPGPSTKKTYPALCDGQNSGGKKSNDINDRVSGPKLPTQGTGFGKDAVDWLKLFGGKIYDGASAVTSTTIHGAEWVASNVLKIDTATAGEVFLNMYKDSKGVYHANFDCWQAKFGYNASYDFFFGVGTSMLPAISQFRSGGQDYRLWAWKGDYINLGAGAELGIYKRMTVAGYDTPQWAVDKSLAMTMTLNLKENIKGNTIISYAPSNKQWWITGFNPAYKNVKASSLTASYSVTFNNSTMYTDFKNSLDPDDKRWVLDDKKYIAKFEF